jgi:outer membrane biogenesis lipoprotein LolB
LSFDRRAKEPESDLLRSNDMDIVSLALRRLLTYGCLLFLLIGCAKQVPTFEPADIPASVIVEHLKKEKAQLRSFRAVGSIQVRGEKEHWSGRAFFLSELPSSLRLEVLNFFGQPVIYAASDGHEFLIWQPGQNRAYQGLAAHGTLARLINFPLDDQEAVLLLAGVVPIWHQAEQKLFKSADAGMLLQQLMDSSPPMIQKIWLEGESVTTTKIERLRDGKLELEVKFSDFMDIHGWFYPKSIVMEGAKTRVTIRYEQIAINENLDQSVFHLTLPEGVEIIPW